MKYTEKDISEKELEFYISKNADSVENELKYITHQKRTDRGPLDMLFVDSGNSLVIAELKIIEDDSMLVQGIDYFHYIFTNLEFYTRNFNNNRNFNIDPNQKPRLFLIAPSFSVNLKNRASWVDIQISLFTYKCINVNEHNEDIIIFNEELIPSRIQPIEVYTIDQKTNYIKDEIVKDRFKQSLKKIETLDNNQIVLDPIKNSISIKVGGKVIAYYSPNRKNFWISTYDRDNEWKEYPIRSDDDLPEIEELIFTNYHKYKK